MSSPNGTCSKCGGTILGDGYREVLHCENAEWSALEGREPDSGVVECGPQEARPEELA